jgi:hypothetical protein
VEFGRSLSAEAKNGFRHCFEAKLAESLLLLYPLFSQALQILRMKLFGKSQGRNFISYFAKNCHVRL